MGSGKHALDLIAPAHTALGVKRQQGRGLTCEIDTLVVAGRRDVDQVHVQRQGALYDATVTGDAHEPSSPIRQHQVRAAGRDVGEVGDVKGKVPEALPSDIHQLKGALVGYGSVEQRHHKPVWPNGEKRPRTHTPKAPSPCDAPG